jgi:hypothetical protein
MTLLVLHPCEPEFVEFEDVVQQFELLQVEEVVGIELEVLEPLQCEAGARCEVGQQVQERQE